jgi:hypothetical protein
LLETVLTYAAWAVAVAIGYFFSLGFDRSGIGGRDRTFTSEAIESLFIGAAFGVVLWLTAVIKARYGITTSSGERLVFYAISIGGTLLLLVPFLLWRHLRKIRNRSLAKERIARHSVHLGPD